MPGCLLLQRRLDRRERDAIQYKLNFRDPSVLDGDQFHADHRSRGSVSDEVVHHTGVLTRDEDLADVVADQDR